MLEPKHLSHDAIPVALEKALRYRLLNEPHEAESICHDILASEPENQEALITLLLATTDQFENQVAKDLESAKEIVPQLAGQYEQAYYMGIVLERWGKAQLAKDMPPDFAVGWFRNALRQYELAESLSEPDDPDAILRWNACARILNRFDHDSSHADSISHDIAASFGDDVPPRR